MNGSPPSTVCPSPTGPPRPRAPRPKAYRAAATKIANAASATDVEDAVRAFARSFNTQPHIDTIEREDLGDATALLVATEPFAVTQNLAQAWFDQERDY